MKRNRRALLLPAMFLALAACGSTSSDAETTNTTGISDTPAGGLPLNVDNQGGAMEGHTPRGFAGTGVGLFMGDNLNAGFPDGDGVQTFLTFELPTGLEQPDAALLKSDVLEVRGAPFDDLGALTVEPVSYDEFSAELFDLSADGPASVCERIGESGVECDVTSATTAAIADGATRIQFRLKFEAVADNDGEGDLAMFFVTDSNTNEPGLFVLELS